MATPGTAPPVPGRARARAFLFGAGVLFGLAAVFVKLACRPGGLSGGQATFVRFAVGLAAVVGLFAARPGTFRPVKRGLLASRGLFGGAAALLYYVAIELIPAGEATLLNNTFPIFAVLLSFVLLGERPTGHLALALAVASAGVFLVLGGGHVTFGLGLGELVGLASAVLGGAAVTSIRALRATDNAPTIFFAMALGGLLVSVPFAFQAWPADPLTWLAAGGAGLVAFVAQLLMTEAYGALSVAEAALWQQLTPIASFVLALGIGERLGGTAVLGVALGVAGVAYGSILGHRPAPDAPAALREAAAGLGAEEP
jgi:drug/metabolite transporter (DMT)-like permease